MTTLRSHCDFSSERLGVTFHPLGLYQGDCCCFQVTKVVITCYNSSQNLYTESMLWRSQEDFWILSVFVFSPPECKTETKINDHLTTCLVVFFIILRVGVPSAHNEQLITWNYTSRKSEVFLWPF